MKRCHHVRLLLISLGVSAILLFQVLLGTIDLKRGKRDTKSQITLCNEIFDKNKRRVALNTSEVIVSNTKVINSQKELEKQEKQTQQERKQLMKSQCQLLGSTYEGTLSAATVRGHFIYDTNKKLVFCDLPKVGSTFLKQVLHIITGHKKVKNPFLITGDEAHAIPFSVFNRLSFDKIFDILQNSVKFLFVRDPYARILSAYVDKIFVTNLVFWDSVGRFIVKKFRKNPDKTSLKCGHNVSFREFIRHIITAEVEGRPRNPHWYPMYEGCRPCHIGYDFIGKMETFKDDVIQLLKYTNSTNMVDISGMNIKNDDEAISLTINRAFEAANSRKSCLSLPQSLERAWKVLQIRGVLSYKADFPYKEVKKKPDISKDGFKSIIMRDMKKFPMNKKSKRDIRQEVMYKAYRSIPTSELEHFRKIFLPDFRLYGYDTSFPKSSFKKNVTWEPFELEL